ncbi:DENN domain-containing protein 1B isoform X1 [Pygocentrus nattereri]|uniref:UDENN domain-containing protein n=1 Tax=Pygocentrus nattereri TaxID=42514 RepID=A0A3B4C9C0_PYGNA|nr:DENN domain-containing protein 1B isoform X1 [Pygocentrus nattereri]
MGSRLKENPEKTFYWFFQASCPIARDKDPGVLFQFPEDFSDEECLQSLPRFCFPYDIGRVRDGVAVQHFTFVLTDLEGCQRFGFCRLTSSSQTCLCILSYLPWFEVFYKLLNNLADYVTKGQTKEMLDLLTALYKHPVPSANGSVTLQLGEQLQIGSEVPFICGHTPSSMSKGSGIPYFIAPDPKALPSIPESRNLTELVVAVDVGNLLQLYASMLFERRILICCSKLSTLTACVHACSGMLLPMYWQHIFIPVLPPHLLDYCCAPMPYLIGVHSSLIERVRSRALEDVVILNVDTNTMESPHDDLKKLPSDVVTALKVRLKRQSTSPGAGVARAFLRAQALLFGGYRDALVYSTGGPVAFSEDLFLTHKSQSMKQFLESAVHLQFFKQFIDWRLEMLNQGKEPDDLFEEEILQCGASSGGSKSYQQWVGNLKKGGGALLLTVKSKAQMCKSVTHQSRLGLKNLISSKEQKDSHSIQRGGSVCGTHTYRLIQSDCLQNRLPITQHFGKSRPRRPMRKNTSPQLEELPQDNSSYGEESQIESVSSAGDLQDDPDLSVLPDPEEMDLLGEIFDTLSAQSSREPGLLYSTRSLDLFNSDCTDFITRRSLTTPSQESLNLSIGNSGSLMSWEEGLEEGPDMEGEGSEAATDQSERDEFGARPSGKESCMDLGRLVDDLTDLGEELKEELVDLQPAQDAKWAEQSGQGGDTREKESTNGNNDDQKENSDQQPEENDLDAPVNDSPKEVTEASLEPQQEHEATEPSLEAQQEHKVMMASIESQQEHEATKPSLEPQPGSNIFINEPCPDKRSEEDQKQEEKHPIPNVLSAVALFQSKASQSRDPAEATRPENSPKGLDTSLKTSPRGPRKIQSSSNRPILSPKGEDQIVKSPIDSPAEDQDLPPIKVSELKKRFEQ